jgi:hypothetical protein
MLAFAIVVFTGACAYQRDATRDQPGKKTARLMS